MHKNFIIFKAKKKKIQILNLFDLAAVTDSKRNSHNGVFH